MHLNEKIKKESELFSENEIFTVSFYDDVGNVETSTHKDLQNAIKNLDSKYSYFKEKEGYSYNSLFSPPFLKNPKNDSLVWDLHSSQWIEH